jgi:hypothetical protein
MDFWQLVQMAGVVPACGRRGSGPLTEPSGTETVGGATGAGSEIPDVGSAGSLATSATTAVALRSEPQCGHHGGSRSALAPATDFWQLGQMAGMIVSA